jgi:hypothetical protein
MRFSPDVEAVRLHRRNLITIATASVLFWTTLLAAVATLT